MEIRKITENKKAYLPLLLLGDEQESMIDRYLEDGDMYVLFDPDAVAECVVCRLPDGIVEIKNIAVSETCQRKGYGSTLVKHVFEMYSDAKRIIVGTGDSILTLPFYNRCGFKEYHRVKNFFTDNYDHPIIEAGVQLRDMVYLSYDCK